MNDIDSTTHYRPPYIDFF